MSTHDNPQVSSALDELLSNLASDETLTLNTFAVCQEDAESDDASTSGELARANFFLL